jgi:hypothetical protein
MEAITGFAQIVVLMVIAYWALDFTGRFWYIMAILVLNGMVGTSLGVLLASATKVRRGSPPQSEGFQLIECTASACLPLLFFSATNLVSKECPGIGSGRPPSTDSSLWLFRLR